VILAAVGPLEGKAGELVLAHMGQHILLADVATLLIVFGFTGPLMRPLLANRLAHTCESSPTRSSRYRSSR
jgi:hypothetical protein